MKKRTNERTNEKKNKLSNKPTNKSTNQPTCDLFKLLKYLQYSIRLGRRSKALYFLYIQASEILTVQYKTWKKPTNKSTNQPTCDLFKLLKYLQYSIRLGRRSKALYFLYIQASKILTVQYKTWKKIKSFRLSFYLSF